MVDPNELAAGIRRGDRGALARGITLVESRRAADQDAAERLLQQLLPDAGRASRIGVTGVPGVGKSTFIEALGLMLCDGGHRVAVLAVDPSSTVTGGSILGDKTRMTELSRRPSAFIRPSPGGGTLGGVASRTKEAMLLCEAAGHDVVLVETIGTGQSEVAVHDMVDYFLLLLSPAAGDELQGIKRGVMELADGVLVHKADGDLLAAARRTAQQCQLALHVLRGDGSAPDVAIGSSMHGDGIEAMWRRIEAALARERDSGAFDARRREQAVRWLDRTVREALMDEFLADPRAAAALAAARDDVARDRRVATAAARDVLRAARDEKS